MRSERKSLGENNHIYIVVADVRLALGACAYGLSRYCTLLRFPTARREDADQSSRPRSYTHAHTQTHLQPRHIHKLVKTSSAQQVRRTYASLAVCVLVCVSLSSHARNKSCNMRWQRRMYAKKSHK